MCISVVLARGLVAEVERRGFEAADLLARSQIEPARLLDIRQLLSASETQALVRHAIELTGDAALGVAIGQHAPESMLQVLGLLLSAQSTLRDAISLLSRFGSLLVEGAVWTLEEHGEQARLSCVPPASGDATRCFMDFALVMAVRVGRHFAPADATLLAVHAQHQAPAYESLYTRVFDCPIAFGQARYTLVFSRSYLDSIQRHADRTVAASLETFAERLLQERAQSLTVGDRVRALLRYEQDWSSIDTKRIARRLGLSARALRRRLAAEDMSMSMMLEETRCRLACAALSRPDTTIKETAERLGFSEPSAFHRAFKRWTGRTPSDYRRHDMFRSHDEVMVGAGAARASAPTKGVVSTQVGARFQHAR